MRLESTEIIVFACCALHNYLRRTSSTYLTPTYVDWEDTETGHITEVNGGRVCAS